METFVLRYASALADVVAADALDPVQIEQQLNDFLETWLGSHELREAFNSPSIDLEVKLKVLNVISSRMKMAHPVRNFFALLIQNGRIGAIPSVLSAVRDELHLRLRISDAEVTSVRELNAEERAEIESRAATLTGLRIHATYKQDPSLLGGVVLRIGDTVYDGSVRGRLEDLREKLMAG